MKRILSYEFACNSLLFIFSILILFHVLILCGFIPYTIVWGGRLNSYSQMIQFEIPSVIINLFMLFVVAVKAKKVKLNINQIIVRICLFAMSGLFLLNTLGNLVSKNEFEKTVFTPVTIVLAFLCFQLALAKDAE